MNNSPVDVINNGIGSNQFSPGSQIPWGLAIVDERAFLLGNSSRFIDSSRRPDCRCCACPQVPVTFGSGVSGRKAATPSSSSAVSAAPTRLSWATTAWSTAAWI